MTVLDVPRADDRPGTTSRGTTVRRAVRRPEIEGLRALAVGLVVLYHVFTGRVSGGVDVFLVLTGFFLVVTLGERYARADGFNPLRPIARSLARLMPAALVVLAVTAAAGLWVMPRTRWRELAEHLTSAVTFSENLRLVGESVEYAAETAAASPMQQFWSLSIQVQVLLVAPFVVAAIGLLLRRAGCSRHGRRVAIVLVAAATGASFAWALVSVRADQEAAYFSTLPRLWELGVGALAGLALSWRPRGTIAAALGWLGVLGLMVCGGLIDGARTFPGWPAAWPVLCAVLVLVAADGGGRFGAHRVLAVGPLQWLGRHSYGIYLWHWPVLVLALAYTVRERPTVLEGLAIVLASLVLAGVTYRLAEVPLGDVLRSRRPAWTVLLVVISAAPLVMAGAATTTHLDRQLAAYALSYDDPDYPGARALLRPDLVEGTEDVELIPPLSVIRDDWAHLPNARCTVETTAMEPVDARYSICVRGGNSAARTIVIVGDSHVAHWQLPLGDIADAHDWRLVSLMNPGCNLSTESDHWAVGEPEFAECTAWQAGLLDRIRDLEPDLVVARGTRISLTGGEFVPTGYLEAWQQVTALGIPIIAVRDNPCHSRDIPDCLAQLGDGAPACDVSPSVYDDDVLDVELPPGVQLLDTRPYFCTPTICPAVVGNVRVYTDDSHISAMYMRTVRPLMEPDFLALTGWR
jgi:peptidoglycan/LPS O-acetylase OafA/YrhL